MLWDKGVGELVEAARLLKQRGIPLRVHWSAPLAALFFGRFEFVPVFWLFGLYQRDISIMNVGEVRKIVRASLFGETKPVELA